MTRRAGDRRQQLAVHYERIMSEGYSSRWALSNVGNQASLAEREVFFEALLRSKLVFASGRVLDLGCGRTSVIPGLDRFEIVGLDLLFDRLQHVDHPDSGSLVNADGCALPFFDESFEVVALFTTLSSVTDISARHQIAREVQRVLKPGGVVIWYDFRYPSPTNRAVGPIGRRKLAVLFPTLDLTVQSITLLPPIARRLGRKTLSRYQALVRLPVLRSHLGGVLVKPRPTPTVIGDAASEGHTAGKEMH